MSEANHQGVGHVAPLKVLVTVWILLMLGTWATVAATWFDLGALNLWIGLLIATVKAVLVAVYFMHLRWDKPFNSVVLLASVFFLLLFIGVAMMDVSQYQPELIPGYAPALAH